MSRSRIAFATLAVFTAMPLSALGDEFVFNPNAPTLLRNMIAGAEIAHSCDHDFSTKMPDAEWQALVRNAAFRIKAIYDEKYPNDSRNGQFASGDLANILDSAPSMAQHLVKTKGCDDDRAKGLLTGYEAYVQAHPAQ